MESSKKLPAVQKLKPIKEDLWVSVQEVEGSDGTMIAIPVNTEANQNANKLVVALARQLWQKRAAMAAADEAELTGKELKDFLESADKLIDMSKKAYGEEEKAADAPSSSLMQAMAKGMVEGVEKVVSARDRINELKQKKKQSIDVEAKNGS